MFMDHSLNLLKEELGKVELDIKEAKLGIFNTEETLRVQKETLRAYEELAHELNEAIGLIEDQKDYL